MPPKKTKEVPKPTKSDAPVGKKMKTKSDAQALRKPPTHPSTLVMVKEAIKRLDSRKGVSSQAIKGHIIQMYPSVDPLRLKVLVRNCLKKGLENGTLVRPANSSVTAGAVGRFRLATEAKKSKSKMENTDPNVKEVPKAAKDKPKPKKEGARKKKDAASEPKEKEDAASDQSPSSQDLQAPKSEDEGGVVSKVPPAKKPKAKKAVKDAEAEEPSVLNKKKAAEKGC
ncbi:unnamed protein product [Ophioblennius macclurei]